MDSMVSALASDLKVARLAAYPPPRKPSVVIQIDVGPARVLLLLAKRLARGRFVWAQAQSGRISLTPAPLSMLREGID
ncbi:IS66 family insertion sequence element accessory protein TnpB [Variovorax saccharolyticus]|uniref:IS66 family insertion sequence element accessory protein TnpB n=1 Tax=Variovorax saccharolyticus TaxID=3053516 RepID=UPI00257542B5|nr:IS66 family insertion sequence element accessory protein TnpB [Variovorax sp. J31P216]MDM0030441.1 IS66 family insertion sequence element accessory protein TnpB [Variovorax sp. J31P216]